MVANCARQCVESCVKGCQLRVLKARRDAWQPVAVVRFRAGGLTEAAAVSEIAADRPPDWSIFEQVEVR